MRRLAGVLAAGILLAGCGGSSHHYAVKAPGHPCTPGNFYMQCALPAPPLGLHLGSPAHAYGVDFGWSGISAARARALGARFGASYFSNDASKNWTAAAVNAYHAAGLATVGVWESTATRAQAGAIAGAEDARSARAQAAAVGNTTRPVLFAIDCDCAPPTLLGYFRGARTVLGSRVNAYGGYSQLWALSHAGLIGRENWQTYAWSGGGWLSASIAPLEQYLNGSAFDNDRALRPAYGQWPYSVPKPKPLLPVCVHHRLARADCARTKAQVEHARKAASASARAYTARGCAVLAQRDRYFATQLRKHPRTRTTYRRAALAATRRGEGQRSCRTFAHRVSYFAHAAAVIQASR